MNTYRLLLLAALLTHLAARADDAPAAVTGLQHDVVFTDYSPLSRSTVLMQRLLTPLTVQHLRRESASGVLREQAIDLAQEKFAVYVPAHEPPQGYALLVFVPPWEEAAVPKSWIPILDSHGMIFVSAANSGNSARVLDRRQPLALLALQNVIQRYPVDGQRIYIGGFSGGSRVALRLALAYPDVFRGALLEAGSDPIGDMTSPLPSAELFRRFQESTQLVYLTNKNDSQHISMDLNSRKSMHDWCVSNLHTVSTPWAGHDLADPFSFGHALDALDQRYPVDAKKLADCRAHIDRELAEQLRQAADLFGNGHVEEGRKLLRQIDTHYGGLAAPRSIELAEKIDVKQ